MCLNLDIFDFFQSYSFSTINLRFKSVGINQSNPIPSPPNTSLTLSQPDRPLAADPRTSSSDDALLFFSFNESMVLVFPQIH